MVLAQVTSHDYQGEVELLLHYWGKQAYVWNTRDLLGCLSVLPCLVKKVNRKLQPPNPGRSTTVKVWVTPPGKEPQPAEVLVEDKGSTEWVVGEGSYE